MPEIKISPFARTKILQQQIDEFLDKVSEAGIVLQDGTGSYLDNGADEFCERKVEQIHQLEKRGDELRRTIQTTLYTELLLPESRGDVMRLLNDLDELLDMMQIIMLNLSITQPTVPDDLKSDFNALTAAVVKSVEFAVCASLAYFRDIETIRDHIHKIGHFESEADSIRIAMKKAIYGSDLPLDKKMLLANGVDVIDAVADQAEDVGDNLSIYALKRAL